MLTIVSTMFGFAFLKVLAAKNTSATLWCRIISRIMVQAQNVPLRPPPFLLPNGKQTQTGDQRGEDGGDPIKTAPSEAGDLIKTAPSGGGPGGRKRPNGHFQDEYLRKVLIKIQQRRLNQVRIHHAA